MNRCFLFYKGVHICYYFNTNMKKRFLYYQVSQSLEHKNTLIITGMRQVGKTTLMKQLFDDVLDRKKLWFDFDNPLDQKVFENEDYKRIYKRLQEMAKAVEDERLFVCIDEIQNFPEITKIMKYLIDHYEVKFIVTGSSNYYLKHLFPESLSGRKFLYHLSPLSFREFLYFRDLVSLEEAQSLQVYSSWSSKRSSNYRNSWNQNQSVQTRSFQRVNRIQKETTKRK